jgi:ribosomal protein S18 acetylase RimI-like enzyme
MAPEAAILDDPELDGLLAGDLELGDLADREQGTARERRRVRKLLDGGAIAIRGVGSLAILRPLEWDTRHFRFGCADVVRIYGAEAPVDEIVERARGTGVRLLSARCRAERADHAHALERAGFEWVDTSVELGVAIGPPAPPSRSRPARTEDFPAMRAVARTFRANRFHLDGRIDPARADALYESWAAKEPVLVADGADGVAGFCGWQPPEADDPLRVGSLTLIVLAPEARGRGHFGELVRGVRAALVEAGARLLVTSTQVHNARALRAFAREGLRPLGARHVFHKWI